MEVRAVHHHQVKPVVARSELVINRKKSAHPLSRNKINPVALPEASRNKRLRRS
ncbi:hypothetical protein PGTUg99_003198 [Puccinia graminis f. sp. tritici]|uniref:Uncharacterized protein n=1 Tax=Puccinia graminis f. sp. tritici TaxID=56615 RepID=A0A5B0SFY3_PUCGR|nr:hypothetical protein PGTUg99_003198 [Puccinia graminis f. sp. tritici]